MLHGQEKQRLSSTTEQQLENEAVADNGVIKDDAYLQQLDYYGRHPLHINEAGAAELEALRLLTPLQVEELLSYRRLLGKLINIYELQAVPGWDIMTIRRLLPYIVVNEEKTLPETLKGEWKGGEHSFTLNSSRVLEKAKGFDVPDSGKSAYLGSRDNVFFRYKYNYKNTLQWGVLGAKDAGESYFDFYSFHLFAKGPGCIKTLALGDFTVNMGQGLVQWQTLAFKKSADVLAIKRQSPVLRPYNSTGEYNFHRGIGLTLQKNKWQATLIASRKRIDGSPVTDSLNNDDEISSFRTSGYHRTAAERAAKGIARQSVLGADISYNTGNASVGLHAMTYRFSLPLNRPDEPYNLFAFNGRSLTNAGMDYSYTFSNLHLFGEAAVDNHFHKAFVQGALLSPAARLDISLLYRQIDKDYQSFYSNAFTESTSPVNESGLYAGISFRPLYGVQINGYSDVFRFPWLKYRVDAPAAGHDYLLQLTIEPDKQSEIYLRYKTETKPLNQADSNTVMTAVGMIPQQDFRLQYTTTAGRRWTIRHRAELVWYDKNGPDAEQGFTAFGDGTYRSASGAWQGGFRLQYFETTGYNARIYALEDDLPFHNTPSFYNKGYRYYFNIKWQLSKRAHRETKPGLRKSIALRWSQTIYRDQSSIDSGLDAITGNHKTEVAVQLMLGW
jgi:hypothetical protein